MIKTIKVLGLIAIMSLSISMVSLAAQTDRWTEQNGTWYLKNEQSNGNVVNSWFQDLDGSWYLLAPGDGHMYAGLIHDTLTDRWYFCQTEHDGWYGRMAHVNGTYTVNGKAVSLTFEQEHNGYFGAITSGLEGLKESGIEIKDVAGIPTESVSSSNGNNTNSNLDPTDMSGRPATDEGTIKTPSDDTPSQEELDRREQERLDKLFKDYEKQIPDGGWSGSTGIEWN